MHATDATNASRTLLLDIGTGALGRGPVRAVRRAAGAAAEGARLRRRLRHDRAELFGGPIRILGIAGDQQAATIGQGCFEPGMMKSTYGTGCFALLNTGDTPVASKNRLLTTIAYQLGGKRTYALEGAIFIAGAAVQWLRDALKMIAAAPRRERARRRRRSGRAGLSGAGLRRARRAVVGRAMRAAPSMASRATPASAELARAALEAVGYQTRDLLDAMRADWPAAGDTVLRVDGGMAASDFTMQFLADILAAPVDRPAVMETTALGAAYLAGLARRRLSRPRAVRRALDAASTASRRRWTTRRVSGNGPAGTTPCGAR